MNAYQYVREKFNKNLPHVSTIRKWYANANTGGKSGITEEAIAYLKHIAAEMKSTGKDLLISLSFDEMAIRQHVQWNDSTKKFMGFVDIGEKDKNGAYPIAKNALVFMVNGLNQSFSLPVAYYFVTHLNAQQKKDLVLEIVTKITQAECKTLNITFDGLASNLSMCELLGASFQVKNFKNYFLNPIDGSKIFITLDACHMLKLLRNAMATRLIYDGQKRRISWTYIEMLEKYRVKRNFSAHKITKRHIQWKKNKMNVSLAAQTLSKSVANSIKYLRDSGYKHFQNSEGTEDYIRMTDKLFDIMNSKKVNEKNVFKSPLTADSVDCVFSFFDEVIKYILSLKIERKSILKTNKRTGFKGFLINIFTIRGIYEEYLKNTDFSLKTLYMSQDLLESLFGRIRSSLGANDNPNVQQFSAAYRKLFIRNEIKASTHANCIDQLTILNIASTKNHRTNENKRSSSEDEIIINTILSQPQKQVDDLELASICIEAGKIEMKISSIARYKCTNCMHVFDSNEKITGVFIESSETQRPCDSTVAICKIANKFVNILRIEHDINYEVLLGKLMLMIDSNVLYTNTDFSHDVDHKNYLIRFIAEEFIRKRATAIAKNLTIENQKAFLRKKLLKAIHFYGQ